MESSEKTGGEAGATRAVTPAKVTRAHRAAAVAEYGGLSHVTRHWVATGEVEPPGLGSLYLPRVAQLIADAEVRGRSAERADVLAYLRRYYESVALDIERGEHVDAACGLRPARLTP